MTYPKHPFIPALLVAAALLLAGCAPEEKTMLLPQATPSGDETANTATARDFSVKKIYTYTYDTLSGLGKSSFLSGCGKNEIHILSMGGQESGEMLEYREVDYRYGFYDVVGDFREAWEDWNAPSGGELDGDQYIAQILPSPDGKQLLVYVRSAFWDMLEVRLYTLGDTEPLLLYEGIDSSNDLFGSFSPDGRWVTFDAGGAAASLTRLVPVYDCSQTASREGEYWWIADTASRLLTPDWLLCSRASLYSTEKNPRLLRDANLYSNGDAPGLISLCQDNGNPLFIMKEFFSPGQETMPDSSLLEEREPLLDSLVHAETTLPSFGETPFPLYRYSTEGTEVYYFSDSVTLLHIDMTEPFSQERVMDFPNSVWDFLPLPSGDVLAVLIQENRDVYNKNAQANLAGQYIQKSNTPAAMQEYWGILSADLYLYPKGASEGHLLYKNLQNLISMEYDDETGRILLETYENQEMTHRRCILLEL